MSEVMTTDTKGYKSAGDSISHEPIKRMLTEKEAALYLGVSIDTVRRMRYSGRLAYVPRGMSGRGISYDIRDLDDHIDREKRIEPQ